MMNYCDILDNADNKKILDVSPPNCMLSHVIIFSLDLSYEALLSGILRMFSRITI